MPDVYISKITENVCLAENFHSVRFDCPDITGEAKPGQFVHILCGGSRVLRRPISICDTDGGSVRIVFENRGEGTKWLAERKSGEVINVLGPLGKGFTIPEKRLSGRSDGGIILVGGGIGTPPMLFTARSAKNNCDVTAILGFRNKKNIILLNEFETVCKNVIVTTDDGSAGIHGFVVKPLEALLNGSSRDDYAAVLSCGPDLMQKTVTTLCKHYNMPCQISLEERMGCGVGACLVCACATIRDGVRDMSRVCADGPVFDAFEVDFE